MTSSDTTALQQLSDGLTDAAERAGAYTVLVNARRRFPASGVGWGGGLVVTTDHALEREEEITVGLPDERQVAATLVGRDPGTDIAVLRVESDAAGALPAAEHAPEEAARIGALVLAVARPLRGVQASLGVLSAAGSPWRGDPRRPRGSRIETYLRSDVTFFPGFSGGPLVDVQGRMLGLNTSGGRPGGGGVTIPVRAVATVADSLAQHGRVRRAYLGIGSQVTRLPAALAERAGGQESGLLIVNVEEDSPAGRAGLLVGDILVGLGGVPVRDTTDLQSALGTAEAGAAVAVRVLRGGEPRDVEVTLGERA